MRHRPDSTFHWIGHYMDHRSNYHVIFPLNLKSAAEVAMNLQNLVFRYLGTPRILHSDNSREFINEIVQRVVKDWQGEVTTVNGHPRNPKCQRPDRTGQQHGGEASRSEIAQSKGIKVLTMVRMASICSIYVN